MIDIADDGPAHESAGYTRNTDTAAVEGASAADAALAGSDIPAARELPIINRKGLHARASAKFVQTVERFDAEVKVSRCGEVVGGRSIMGLLTLAAAKGTTIHVSATGPEAAQALDAIAALLANRFGEEE